LPGLDRLIGCPQPGWPNLFRAKCRRTSIIN
jgi:hypothetical protein